MNLRDAIRLEIPPHFTHDYGNRWDRERHMPFAAIGSAIAGAVGSAFAAGAGAAVAVGATAGGIAATAAGVIGAVGLVATYTGIAMTVVGAITGNTKLMKIGGMVGLAGGVTSLGIGAINAVAGSTASTAGAVASSAAAPAASSSSMSSAMGGLGKGAVDTIGQQVGSAITPTFASTGTGALSSTIGTGADAIGATTGPLTQIGSQAAVTPPSLAAPSIAAPAVPQVATQSASFFDQLTEPKTLLGIGQVGMGMLQGSAAEDMQNKQLNIQNDMDRYRTDKTYDIGMANVANNSRQLDQAQEKIDNDQALINRRYNDLNSPGGNRTGVSIDESKLPVTDRQENKSVKKANVSREVADILAPKKKSTGAV